MSGSTDFGERCAGFLRDCGRAGTSLAPFEARGKLTRVAGLVMESTGLRLPLGSDTVAAIEAKNAFVAKELEAWRTVATSTDFPR